MRLDGIFATYDRSEDAAQTDMRIRGERLSAYKAKTVGHVWQAQPNGEQWLVPVYDGALGVQFPDEPV